MKSLFYSILIIPFVFISCGGGEEAETEESTNETESTTTEEVVEEEVVVVENSFNIETNIVGIFQIGQEVPDPLPEGLKMRHFLEKDKDDSGNEIEHTHNVIFTQLEDVVELIMERGEDEYHEDKSIEEMMILSNYYKTDEEVTVGTTKEDFIDTYGDASFWYDRIHNRYYAETDALVGAQFIFDEKDITKKAPSGSDFQQVNASYVAEGAKIKMIRIIKH